ncbi:MAG: 2-C-methyl-D-erythritol 4-phosphate cytidylyltransferase [Lentisphaeria bacterium]|nr:2-C-methyl-D-erythritol 4-phosphate cytidylyltransferase [Lentisphaeria bacterium]
MISDLGVIIAASGSSQRYGVRDKLLEELGGMPVFLHSIINFLPLVSPGNLVVAVRPEALDEYRRIAGKFLPEADISWTAGGNTRVESVLNALTKLPLTAGLVAIHDAARPLATAQLLLKVAERAGVCGGAIAASKVTDSLKLADADGRISAPVARDAVWHAETPQVFDIEHYRRACSMLDGKSPTDDAEIMRLAGYPVELVESGMWNLKLTAPDDLVKLRQIFPGS